jgi:hypothetical protein
MLDSLRLEVIRPLVDIYCIALDPGETTGICIVRSSDEPWVFEYAQLGPYEHHLALYGLLVHLKPANIICESFENRGQDAAILASREYIGIVKMHLQRSEATGVWQSASTGKKFWDDGKLKQHGLWIPGRKHARDAVRHYCYWRTFKENDLSLFKSDRFLPVEMKPMLPEGGP